MFAMQLLAGFSMAGTLLTLVGIYGVLSLSVAAQRREIAIRIAVGAERHDTEHTEGTESQHRASARWPRWPRWLTLKLRHQYNRSTTRHVPVVVRRMVP
jgi:hypothetical protein